MGEINGFLEFGAAILDTMQNWMDNAQTRVPGYRDRIVLVKHTKEEGPEPRHAEGSDQRSRRGYARGPIPREAVLGGTSGTPEPALVGHASVGQVSVAHALVED
jgi:hypothetical protein